MNKRDFVVNCAKLAGWKAENGYILAPNGFFFNIQELSSGFLTKIKQDDWDLLYYEALLDKCISMINFNHVYIEGKFEILIHSKMTIIFSRDGFSRSEFHGEGKELKEKVLHKYFDLMRAGDNG